MLQQAGKELPFDEGADLAVDEFSQVGNRRLRAEPAAPDPAEHHGDEQKPEDQDQDGKEKEVELLDPDLAAEKQEGSGRRVEPEQRLAAYAPEGQSQEEQGDEPLYQLSFRANPGNGHS